ncbi:MAG TPA: M1 family metallopeptidase [Dehalococcoidia bacterium]|jgi:puromycin-sensitive aminopeptidase|nr:M1 family metallopeptidase [Dehalococcoidia bacterium]MDP7213068.1 M1 family metallopeptidase [Dehalococcoidia bacterium]MDP7515265.1 M1 family metallopeptidase [Dehalococcoidia bacterium]HJM52813.1 M1 family metallopeptidase [Dehalococcoidia bacterium]|tara:strand:- start:8650 stop:11202 length:2553 start_codon:yes stop_codon:yes gene_type:complete
MPDVTQSPYRLPKTVTPSHYELTLEPNLMNFTFAGTEAVNIAVVEPTDVMVVNAIEIEIDEAWVSGGDSLRTDVSGIEYDEELQRATLTLSSAIDPGDYVLHARFRGTLNDQLHGFYRSTFKDEAGVEHTIATTQMESTDARRAFPCWDEPEFKASFGITLKVPEDQFAMSNGAEISNEVFGGVRTVSFADTMVMSTYLVAFIVGPFEATDPVDVNGTPLRIIYPRGKGHLTEYSLEAGEHALRFFENYYGIPYPGDKLDMVAVPDFAFGAMENLGAITYREVLLLLDRDRATEPELLRVADVIAHEIAHMWFGDLVTMRWWNGIWLNEAFATFMATLSTDAFRPEWERWVQFGMERSMAFDVDSLEKTRPIEIEVNSPSDAEGMFDLLTYEKGGSVLRMLEQYLGDTPYRDGIRNYLTKHSYGNTETNDLWDAIEETTGQPARRIMDSWIYQGGYPVVSVETVGQTTLRLSQRRFRFVDDPEGANSRWSVPVILRVNGESQRVLLEDGDFDVELDGPVESVIVNAGGHGFYRVRYSPELLAKIDPAEGDLSAIERYMLIDDAWASVVAGNTAASDFVAFARGFADETDAEVWSQLTGCLTALDRLLEGEGRDAMRTIVRELVSPALDRIGWEPSEGQSARDLELRGTLIRSLAITGNDQDARERARGLHARYLEDPGSIDANVAAAVTGVVANGGSDGDYDTFFQRFKSPLDPQEEQRYLRTLVGFPTSEQMSRTLTMTLSGEIRTQDAPYLLAGCMVNRENGPQAWAFIRDNWEQMNEVFPSNSIVRMLSGIRSLSRPEIANEVLAFFEEHEVPQGALSLSQHLERLRINVNLRERESERLGATLTGG